MDEGKYIYIIYIVGPRIPGILIWSSISWPKIIYYYLNLIFVVFHCYIFDFENLTKDKIDGYFVT